MTRETTLIPLDPLLNELTPTRPALSTRLSSRRPSQRKITPTIVSHQLMSLKPIPEGQKTSKRKKSKDLMLEKVLKTQEDLVRISREKMSLNLELIGRRRRGKYWITPSSVIFSNHHSCLPIIILVFNCFFG
ncbi:hypothetical protein VP01_720g2 [Puccinia sorghi]|uniref:No apical meristem-associated C-terminal domain-containing protein n=1 Tax=Puccinia sorghi TaxID=27349 RepID=A0A0L6UFE7_9BASI|nr:hypothetical protein VP01_720g2 [Puccinia sorghi]